MATARLLAATCREFEELLARPAGRNSLEEADDTLPAAFRDLAQKDSAWEGLDEAEIATSAPLLIGPRGLLELSESAGQDNSISCIAFRRYSVEACARFLDLYGPSRPASTVLKRQAASVASACKGIFKNDVDNKVGLNALLCLLNALEVPNMPLPPEDFRQELLRELKLRHSRLTAGQSSMLHKVLAVLADAAAAAGEEPGPGLSLATELRTRLLGTLQRETTSSKPTLELVSGLLEACSVLLRRHADDFLPEELVRLYNIATSVALTETGAATRLGPRRAALRLFQDHALAFRRLFAREAQSLPETEARKPGDTLSLADAPLLNKMLASTTAAQADVAAAGRGMLDAVLRALSDGVLMDLDSREASRKRPLDDSVEAEPPEAAVVRGWYPRFHEMVLCREGEGSDRLTGARSLGALVPAVLRLDGPAVVLDFLEVILDAAETAAQPAGLEEEDPPADPPGSVASAAVRRLTPSTLPELAEALSRTIPAVSRWLTGTQWVRLLQVGVQLIKGFGRAFTKKRPYVARAVAKLLSAFRLAAPSASESESGSSASLAQPYEALVAQGIVSMVTEDESLQALWELVLTHFEQEKKMEELQLLTDSLTSSSLMLARQGVENYLRLQQQEEKGQRKMADYVSQARARGSLTIGAATVAMTMGSQDVHQAIAEVDPVFAVNAVYVYEQASQTSQFLRKLSSFLDRAFGSGALPERRQLLTAWAPMMLDTVVQLVSSCRSAGAGPPPPGVFRLLRVALSAAEPKSGSGGAGEKVSSLPLGFLEEIASGIDGYEGVVVMEAMEALLAVPPAAVRAERWLPVFQRALGEGLHDPQLARHVLSELERWRDAGADLDWSSLLPNLAIFLAPASASAARRSSAAQRRATRGLATAGQKAEDRRTLLRRLLRFVGSLGGACHGLVLREPMPEELRKPISKLGLKLSITLGGSLVELEPSEILPHLARLLQRGPRRGARLAAGEALHALLRHVIGNDSLNPVADAGDAEASTAFADVLRSPLLPLALRAASDEDATLAELFKSLLKQLVAWMAHRPPSASLSSLRDALLEAMGDAASPALRYTAAQFFAELLVALQSKPTSAKRLLQYLISAAKHVDRSTQLAALRALRSSWCSLSWEAEADLPALDVMQVVILCLQTSHRDGPSGFPAQALALQLGGRLLESLATQAFDTRALPGNLQKRVTVPESLVSQLQQGSALPECAARHFCRQALQKLRCPVAFLLDSMRAAVDWKQLAMDSGSSTAETAQHALELLSVRLDTPLWRALLEGSVKVDGEEELARRAVEESSLLVPWSPQGGLDPGKLSEALRRFPAREREQVLLARTRALLALVATARLGAVPSASSTVAVLITLVLDPWQLQVGQAKTWRSIEGRRRALRCAAEALSRCTSLPSHLAAWQRQNPHMDLVAASSSDTETFEVFFHRWPEHRDHNALGVAERMAAYVDGLEVLRDALVLDSGGLWSLLFNKWAGGVEACLKAWQRSVAGRTGPKQSQAASAQILLQALVRFLLVALPQQMSEPVQVQVISALLCIPRPPADAMSRLLEFFSQRAKLVFEASRPWPAGRKRLLLSWLCDFVSLAEPEVAVDGDFENDSAEKEKAGGSRRDEGSTDLGPVLQGSVLAALPQGSTSGRSETNLGQALARLLRELPTWHEWAVSDAAHGGADDEDAPPVSTATKRRKLSGTAMAASMTRVRRARADRTGLYQLALLLRNCCSVDPVLMMLHSAPELCQFLSDVLRTVLGSDHAPPRTKGLFLEAIPPLLLKAEVLQSVAKAEDPEILSNAASAVEATVRDMVTNYFPLNSREYQRNADEYSTYLILLEGLFRSLERSAPSMRLLAALHSTLRVEDHRESMRLRDFVKRFVRHVVGSAGVASFKALLQLFLDQSLDDRLKDNIRFAIMEKLALPLLWELVASPQSCKECWVGHWQQLLQYADPDISFANLRMRDVDSLNLKVQEMAGIYGIIEVLFVRTPAELLKEQILPELGGSSPSRDVILIAKRALKKPMGWEKVDPEVLRRCQLRIYAALSAAVCATQTKQEMYSGWLFEKVTWDDSMVEPWELRKPEMSKLTPDSRYNTFPRPGYSFAYLSAALPGRAAARARTPSVMGTEEGSTLLGGNLWAATPAFTSGSQLPASMLRGPGTLGRAAAARASQELTLMLPERQRRKLAATAATGGSMPVMSLVVTGSTDGLVSGEGVPLPPGEEGAAMRLQAVLAGRRLQSPTTSESRSAALGTWQTEWLEHDEELFPSGPSTDCALTLFLVMLRTLDVLTERFGVEATSRWLQAMLAIVEKASADFRLRLLMLRIFIHRADALEPVLLGRHVEVFRFVTSMLLDPRFGAEKRFHYLARDAVSTLLVPKFGQDVVLAALPRDCLMDAERLLHQLQTTAPHRMTYWQKAHLGILRLFASYYLRPGSTIRPDGKVLLRQLTAKNRENALILQQSGLRQLAIFLEYSSFDPMVGGSLDGSPVETAWKDALLNCVVAKDLQLAAYACGAIALLAKWHPVAGRSILQDCCAMVESPPIQARLQDRSDGLRLALCAEQILVMCPWALSDAPEEATLNEAAMSDVSSSPPRRKLFARMLQRLTSSNNVKVVRALLSGLLELCRDCTQLEESSLTALADANGRRSPPRPSGDAIRVLRRSRLEEVLLTLRAGEIWRRSLHCKDEATQLVAAKLVCAVAAHLDDENLLSCLGLMLEAEATLREKSSADTVEHRIALEKELLSLCIAVCDRRPDVARGEVAEGVLAFLVRVAVSEEWRGVKEVVLLKVGEVKAQEVQDMADQVKSSARDFWEAQLSGDAPQRVADLCLRLGGKAEHESSFIPATLQLLLSLARKSADYRQIKNKPLSDIEFRPMQISAASWGSTGLPQTFQLGSAWASTLRGSHSQTRSVVAPGGRAADVAGSVAASLSAEALPRELRARRKELPPVPSFAGKATGAGKETTPTAVATGTGTGLLRHTEEDSRRVAIFRQERETKAALATLERREREGAEEDATVDLVSGYREGSYPDVEVSLADIFEPLARAAAEDMGLAEELLLAMWSGMANSATLEVLSSAFNGLVTGCLGDVSLVHFLHSLVVRCSADYGKTLPLQAFQRTLSSSQLSGIQALEELLPAEGLGKVGILRGGDGETGRCRAVLSALYSASSSLGEEPSMSAVVAQLKRIKAFSSPHSSLALSALHQGQVLLAQESLVKVLKQEEAAIPSWELQMASAARVNALEELMSWKDLRQVLNTGGSGGADVGMEKLLRSDLGMSLFEDSKEARAALELRMEDFEASAAAARAASPQSAALLAIHAISTKKWDQARRLVYQGYDSFSSSWARIPLLAARARHERLSALPLLQRLESFLDDARHDGWRQPSLSPFHDRFAAWIDSALGKVALCRLRADDQTEAEAYSELGQRCREAKNLTAAQDMMKRCLHKRKIQDFRFFDNVLELKLAQREKRTAELCTVARKEISKHQEPAKALPYTLILAKIAKVGYERQEMDHLEAWQALVSARGLAEKCTTYDKSNAHAKVAEFADAVLRREEARNQLSTSRPEQVELVEFLITGVLTALVLGDGDDKIREAFQQAHERLPRVFELLAVFKGCSHVFEASVASVPSWAFLRWLPQALAHLPNVPALQKPLQALAADYPQALFWPLQLSSHQDIVGQRQSAFQPLWAALEKTKAPVQTAVTFTKALDRLTHPEKSLPTELRSCRDLVLAQEATKAKDKWRILWRKHVEVQFQDLAGQVHLDFGQRVKAKMQDLARKLGLVVAGELRDADLVPGKREAWSKFFQEMQQLPSTKQWPNRKAPIEAFSPWFSKFDAHGSWLGAEEQLEVLGQYRGLRRPDIRTHARITRFGNQLLIMASKQMPKRLVVLGSDEAEHWFLVKGGEDVRLDERVEQLFGIVNSVTAVGTVGDAQTVGLRVRTYAVVPLLPDLGVLEWVRETKPLKAIVQEVAKAKDLNEVEAHKLRIEWSKRFGGQAVQRYSKIFELPKADAVVAFQRCVAAMPSWASLKAFFWSSAMGPEAFWHTRQRFAASLACASAACYLLGIGDRHLDNYLLCLRTAEIVPIDFGYSFGIGALLPVPELMPFRLTNFLLSTLQPLSGPLGHGTFRDSLEEVLRTCRARSGMLLDVCALFIREPLLDWTTESKRRGITDLEFLPKRRLQFLHQRLQGIHPASVLRDELMDNGTAWVKDMARRSSKPLEVIVAGLEDEARAKVYRSASHLSPSEQADCLIRQATDPNILGRAWEGWAPEI